MEQDAKKRETQQINACCTSPFPAFIEDTEDELKDGEFEVPLKEKIEIPLNEDDKPLEEGDHIWATGLFPEAEQIQATASISQRLAEGFQQKSTLTTFDKCVPLHLWHFHSVLSKNSFNKLPKMKPWYHAVELTSDTNSKTCKIYPLSVSK